MNNTVPPKTTQPIFSDDAHRRRAMRFLDKCGEEYGGLSQIQLGYIAAAATDKRIDLETKAMLTLFAIKAGPELKNPVGEDELIEEFNYTNDCVAAFFLASAKPEGRA